MQITTNRMEQKKDTYKVIIAGTRAFEDYDLLCRKCDETLQAKALSHTIVIVSGTARGADRLGERYASERGFAVERHPADWTTYGKAAGFRRNAEMATVADALICFWDGQSRGTWNIIDLARRKGLETIVIEYNRI